MNRLVREVSLSENLDELTAMVGDGKVDVVRLVLQDQ